VTLSGNSFRQTVHTHRASVHHAAKLVAALLRVARVTAGLQKVMAAYHRVYDSHHLHVDCQETESTPEPYARQSSNGLPLPFSQPMLAKFHITAADYDSDYSPTKASQLNSFTTRFLQPELQRHTISKAITLMKHKISPRGQ